VNVRNGVDAFASSTSIEKSMRNVPVPQPPATDNAWMIPSDVELFGSVETSTVHGFGASKRPPPIVVGGVAVVVVVLWRVVGELVDDDVDVVLARVVDDVLDVVVGRVLVVGTTGVVVRVVDVVALVVVDEGAVAQRQPVHAAPAQSPALSHCSPERSSRNPSPQADAAAVKTRRFVERAVSVPSSAAHSAPSTLAVSRTLRSAPHVFQRTRSVLSPPRTLMRARPGAQPLAIVTLPASSTTIASNGRSVPGTSGSSTRKRTSGHGGGAAARAGAAATTNATAQSSAVVELSTRTGRSCATRIEIRRHLRSNDVRGIAAIITAKSGPPAQHAWCAGGRGEKPHRGRVALLRFQPHGPDAFVEGELE
jgi:hypothetical protein